MSSAADTWTIFRDDATLTWTASFPGGEITPAMREWQLAVLEAGEISGCYRTYEVEWMGYRRDRDGYLGDFLRRRPELLEPGLAIVPGQIFDSLGRTVATSLLTAVVDNGAEVTVEEDNLHDLGWAADVWSRENLAPVQIMSYIGDPDTESTFMFDLGSDIWFPWTSAHYRSDPRPGDVVDNRRLAVHNAPRLNAFFGAVLRATAIAGGEWDLDFVFDPFRFELDAEGVNLDAIPPGRILE